MKKTNRVENLFSAMKFEIAKRHQNQQTQNEFNSSSLK